MIADAWRPECWRRRHAVCRDRLLDLRRRCLDFKCGDLSLGLTLLVATLSLGVGRTTVLQGVIHLVIFAVFLFLAVVPYAAARTFLRSASCSGAVSS